MDGIYLYGARALLSTVRTFSFAETVLGEKNVVIIPLYYGRFHWKHDFAGQWFSDYLLFLYFSFLENRHPQSEYTRNVCVILQVHHVGDQVTPVTLPRGPRVGDDW